MLVPRSYDLGSAVLTAARTDDVITTGIGAAGEALAYLDRLDGIIAATIEARLVYGSGGTTAIAIVETSNDAGATWVEIARFDFTTASARKLVNLSALTPKATVYDATTTLSANSAVDGILGPRIRARVTSTGTYAASTTLSLRLVAR